MLNEAMPLHSDFWKLFDQAPVAIAVLEGRDLIFKYVNETFLILTGKTHVPLMGRSILEVFPEIDERIRKIYQEVLNSGETYRNTQFAVKADYDSNGHTFEKCWDIVFEPIKNGRQQVKGMMICCYEISREVKLKKAEKQHQEAVKELEEALHLRDEFISIASHELKTPLTSLQLNLQLLEKRAERGQENFTADKMINFLTPLSKQVQRLGKMVDNLLDLSRIRSKRILLDRDVFDLCSTVQEVATRLESMAQEKNSSIITQGCEELLMYGDRLRIEQVVTNLLSNALKYGSGSPVKVAVEAFEGKARVIVEDRGIGISPENLTRIFERFERATFHHKSDSMGLGLFIVRHIVEAHGGEISVISEVGQGSIFTILLPLRQMDGIDEGH